MNAENSEVLYKFRVTGTDGKPFIIFNGVSANSWLSPVGIRLHQDDKDQVKLPQRPKSSGSIMIIRHHPSPKGLNRDEVIQGVRIHKRLGEEKPEERPRPRSEMARPSGSNSRHAGSRLTSAGRPHTAFSDKVRKRQPLQRKQENHEHPNLELTIRSLDLKRTAKSSAPDLSGMTDKSEFMTVNRLHSALIPKNIYTSAMFAKRAKSAPPNVRGDTTKPAMSSRDPALYWRAKSAYHRKMLATSSDMDWDITDSSSQSYKGSMLRPLMYCEDGELKHSAGCPYKCKGCFRACLVSKDYLEKMKKRKEPPPKKNIKHRPMVKKDARFVMHMALARNQPIYKIVHGDEYSRTEAWAEKHSKANSVSEIESSSEGEQLSGDVPAQNQSMRSGEYNIKDVTDKAIQQEDRNKTGDVLYLDHYTTTSNNNATVENTKHSAQFKLFERNTMVTEYEPEPNVSSENILYCNRNISNHNYTENGMINRRLSKGINKHCSFDKSSPGEFSPSSSGNKDRQSGPSMSCSVSPAEKAIRTLYETECKTPESPIARSESSERSDVFSKKSETFSGISERSKVLSENPDVLNEKVADFRESIEHFDDSLTDESTVSLDLPSDDDVDTIGDSVSSELEESYDSNRETSPSMESTATQSEYSICRSQRHHNYKSVVSNNTHKHNKINNGANTIDQKVSLATQSGKVSEGDNGIRPKRALHKQNKANCDNPSVTSHTDDNGSADNKNIVSCAKQEGQRNGTNIMNNKANDKNITADDEIKNAAVKIDVKHPHNKKIVTKKRTNQRNKKLDENKTKVTKKNVKQTRINADNTDDDEDTKEKDSDGDASVNSDEEGDNNSDILANANAEYADPENNEDSGSDSDNEDDNSGFDTECSKEESGDTDTAEDGSQVNNSEAETDHNNNDTDDSHTDNCDSGSDGSVEDDGNSSTQDDVCNDDDDDGSDIEDDSNKDNSESDDNTESKDRADTEGSVNDDSEYNDIIESKDKSDREDNDSDKDRGESDTEDRNDSGTEEDARTAADDNSGNSDVEDNDVSKEEDESETENNETDTDNGYKKDDSSECHTGNGDSEEDDDTVADEESGDSVSNDSGDDDDDDGDDDDDNGSHDNSDNADSSSSSDIRKEKSRRR